MGLEICRMIRLNRLVFNSYSRAKDRYMKGSDQKLSPTHHLASAAEAGALVNLDGK
ncbi:hypothetical protein HPP92_023987 [Vanilla planifolia]|uniref:Uncharacterized protein n=1 Tax=Vanilla planifolia TaxID=51239 RepID=A0A835PMQ8_VANPL|nr:hypothetical protein HPP92_023987 [Vanilla planifolia]